MRSCPVAPGLDFAAEPYIFVADGDAPPGAAPVVTPAELAQRAVAELVLPRPTVRRSPDERNDDDGTPYTWVNLWTWYWAAPTSWRPSSRTASAGGASATVTAIPTALVFEPGDGSGSVSCPGPGRPWQKADGDAAPGGGGCGYVYRRVSEAPLTSRVSIRWAVSWSGSGGAGGELPEMTTSAASALRVQQVQVVNR